MASNRKMLNMKVVHLIETSKYAFGRIFIRGRLLPQKRPARCSQFKPNSFGKFARQRACRVNSLPGEKLAG
jgi:hypothetical protein